MGSAGKALTVISGILVLLVTWVFAIGYYNGNPIYAIGGFLNISTIFGNGSDLGLLITMIIGLLVMISGILILIGVKARALAIIFGIVVMLPGIGLILETYAGLIFGAYLSGGLLAWSGPAVAGFYPVVLSLITSNGNWIVMIGFPVLGLLSIIGGAINKD
ncbi:MAG TPA: hypothetical protein VKK79_22430 [Candidatus Lokiarchaeia archaeon]|nr:hypothetical protein [Candidatus Lokiarchaeia archaeon]